jgi:MFS transporter, putative metabolite:H+ symporter
MSSGIGAIIGAYAWGWLADRIGRRIVFIGTVLNFSIATGLLYFTPDNGWIYLSILRFFVGCPCRKPKTADDHRRIG